jgi:uncharacterized iron-regulated membrane protein
VRKVIFWPHLIAGVVAGVLILLMSATGVLLTYEKQMLAWADRTPAADISRIDAILTSVRATAPDSAIGSVTISADQDAPVLVSIGPRTLAVNAYTGTVLGDASPGLRRFFRSTTELHRWLAAGPDRRPIARALTGWSNLLFLFIVVSGLYLWFPRRWSQVRAVIWFRGTLRGKARDFNWHNVIGLWSAVPLFFVVLTALPMSFPWANAAVFRLVGEEPPAAPARGGAERGTAPAGARATASTSPAVLEPVVSRAAAETPDWRTITLRVPPGRGPLTAIVDRGTGGQPHLRETLTVDSRSGEVMRSETFATQTPGRRLRTLARFGHTGEVLGVAGQTVAGAASAGAVVLVWTGLSLAWRRFTAWRRRRRDGISADQIPQSNAA